MHAALCLNNTYSGVLGNMRNDFPAISDSRTRSPPAKPREPAPRPWPDEELGTKASNAKGVEPGTPLRTPTRQKHATRVGGMQKAAGDTRSPRKRPRTRKGRQAPRGPAARQPSRGPGNARKRKKGTLSGPPPPGALSAPPRPLPAQRAPGAGGALVSHRVAPAVPSALAGLTSGFGMGPGVPRPPWPPAPGGRCGAGCVGAGRRPTRPGGLTALEEGVP